MRYQANCALPSCYNSYQSALDSGSYNVVMIDGEPVTTDGNGISTYTPKNLIDSWKPKPKPAAAPACHGFLGCAWHGIKQGFHQVQAQFAFVAYWANLASGVLGFLGPLCEVCSVLSDALAGISAVAYLVSGNPSAAAKVVLGAVVGSALGAAGRAMVGDAMAGMRLSSTAIGSAAMRDAIAAGAGTMGSYAAGAVFCGPVAGCGGGTPVDSISPELGRYQKSDTNYDLPFVTGWVSKNVFG